MTTVAELLVRRHEDDHVGLVTAEDGSSWTWRQVVAESARRAALLEAQRRPGPFHVGVLLENVPDYVFLLGAAALAGATVVGINPTRRGEELAGDIRHTDCQLVVTEPRLAGLLAGLDLGLDADRVVGITDERWNGWLAAHAGAPVPPADRLPDADALFVLIFTSGSTGAPKAVRASQGRVGAMAAMAFGPDDVIYCAMPLFHGNALAASLLPAMGAGATIVLRRRFSASSFLPDVRRHGVTYFNSVGRALSYILATPPSPADRDHRVHFALAPESSSTDIAAFSSRFGIPVLEGYGSSEGTIRLLPVPDAPPGALGRPDPDVDIAVVDPETGEECPPAVTDEGNGALLNGSAAIGELVRRDAGAATFEGYYRNPEATAARRRNGWFWSGDLAYRDETGLFFFAGRSVDWLRVDGENFAAAPVERILGRYPDVAAVAVYAVPDPHSGDQVMAAVELRDGAAFDPDGFAAFVATQPDLGPKWWPRLVRIVRDLPVTATSKVAKQGLRREAWLTDDPVWWRVAADRPYVLLDAVATTELAARFDEHGRRRLLPPGAVV